MIEFGHTLPLVGVTCSIAKEPMLKFVSKNQWKVTMFKVMSILLCEGDQVEKGEQGNNDEEPPLPDQVVHPWLYEMAKDSDATS